MKKDIFIALLAGLGAFITYLFTLPPSIHTGDSGEIATAIFTWGIAHPTGFPTYLILAKFFSYLLPFFEFAYRLNIFSALTSSITIIIIFFILRRLQVSPFGALAASLSLAFGFTFWTHAETIQVYSATALFIALGIFVYLSWRETKKSLQLYLLAAILGFGIGTHLTFLLIFPFLILHFGISKLKGENIAISLRKIIICFFIFLFFVFLVYSYIPLRAWQTPEFNWGDPSSKESFINYITQRDWSYKMAGRDFESWKTMLGEIGRLFRHEFTRIGLIFIFLGAVVFFKKNIAFFYGGLSVIFLNILILGFYGTSQTTFLLWRYYLPSYIVMAMFIGAATDSVLKFFGKRIEENEWVPAKILAALIFPSLIFTVHFKDLNNHNNYLIPKMAQDISASLPSNSVLFISGDTFSNAVLYRQMVLKERQDLLILDKNLFTHSWYREQKGREMEKLLFISANNITAFIKSNPNATFYSLFELPLMEEIAAETWPEGLVFRYSIKSKKEKINAQEVKKINDKFWQDRDLDFLKNEKIDKDALSKNIPLIYMAALNNYGAYLVNNEFMKEGISYFEKVLDIRQNNNESKNALYNLMLVYGHLGEKEKVFKYKSALDDLK